MTRFDVVRYISHGVGKRVGLSEHAIPPNLEEESEYRVSLLNDDFTPMEFVVQVLEEFFDKTSEEAKRIMLQIHRDGAGECGVFTYDVAVTKMLQVMDLARRHEHPLQCVTERKGVGG